MVTYEFKGGQANAVLLEVALFALGGGAANVVAAARSSALRLHCVFLDGFHKGSLVVVDSEDAGEGESNNGEGELHCSCLLGLVFLSRRD